MTRGFFNRESLKSPNIKGKPLTCASCGLYKDCRSPKMKPYGNFRKHILNIGEAPGEHEDRRGKPWQGRTGRLLQETYERYGIDLFEDCVNINSVNCRPPNNYTPTNHQIDCCRVMMVNQALDEYNPKAIVILGGSALHSFLKHRYKKELHGINTWRGYAIPDQEYKCWVFPIWHPSFVHRMERAREVRTIWHQDIQHIVERYNVPLPSWPKPKIHMIGELDVLNDIDTGIISVDYETTGLKPHAHGHQIVSASVSPDENTAYTFLMPHTKRKREPFIRLLTNRSIAKIGHHIKFEDTWTRHKLRVLVENWAFDSMLAAHILDNRSNTTSLSFQEYVNLGTLGYDEEVAPYLKSIDNKDGNSMNTILDLIKTSQGIEKLLTYNAMDTITQFRIANIQMKRMEFDFLPF